MILLLCFPNIKKRLLDARYQPIGKKLMLCTEVTGFDFSEVDETVQEGDISEFCVVLKEEGTGREAFLCSDGRVTFQNSVKSNASI